MRKLLSRKFALWRTWIKTKNNDIYTKYAKLANECKLAIHHYDVEREQKLLRSNHLGAFYDFVNKR